MLCSTDAVVCVGCSDNTFEAKNGKTYDYYRAVFVSEGNTLELTCSQDVAQYLHAALSESGGIVSLPGLVVELYQRQKLKVKVVDIVRC